VKPLLLDLFCGAGGAAVGYHRAGFDVVGVDIKPQPNYPFWFDCGDALMLERHLDEFGPHAIHASPPCQAYSKARKLQANEHPDLIADVRRLLTATGLPWVIENVPGSPLINPVVLEGQMFDGLATQRPRWFETNWPLDVPFLRAGRPAPVAKMGRPPKPGEWMHVVGHVSDVPRAREAMGIDWMTQGELAQAIPPAYTELIGHQLLQHVRRVAA
jgi:DNA (cytosine-5)-methyltransferase 1